MLTVITTKKSAQLQADGLHFVTPGGSECILTVAASIENLDHIWCLSEADHIWSIRIMALQSPDELEEIHYLFWSLLLFHLLKKKNCHQIHLAKEGKKKKDSN